LEAKQTGDAHRGGQQQHRFHEHETGLGQQGVVQDHEKTAQSRGPATQLRLQQQLVNGWGQETSAHGRDKPEPEDGHVRRIGLSNPGKSVVATVASQADQPGDELFAQRRMLVEEEDIAHVHRDVLAVVQFIEPVEIRNWFLIYHKKLF